MSAIAYGAPIDPIGGVMLARNRVRFAQRVVPVHAILERRDQAWQLKTSWCTLRP